ncbi:MAG: hypothetical protein HZA50_04455 [Planctomycetes bacterium]|nr:hypothetical protein [Planctomycetota bacterium]
MSELYPPDIELNDLSGTADAEQEVLYIPIGQSPYYTSFYRMLYRLCDVARRAGDLRVYKDGDLTFGARTGKVQNGTNSIAIAATAGNALTDDATNYIYYAISGSTASLVCGTNGYPLAGSTPHVPLASIVCAGGIYSFDDITDARGLAFVRAATAMSVEAANTLVGGSNSDADALHKHNFIAENLWSVSHDTSKVLRPDGSGGVAWGDDLTGSGGAPTDAAYWLGGTHADLPSGVVPTGENGITVDASCGTIGQTFGTGAGQAAAGNDSRFTDAANHAALQTTQAHGLTLASSTAPGLGFADGTGGVKSASGQFSLDFAAPASATGLSDDDKFLFFNTANTATKTITADEMAGYFAAGTGGAGASETIVRKLTQLALTATTQTAYTCPTSYCAQVSINLANLDATSQCAATTYVVDVSGSATAQIANGLLVNKNNSHAFGQKINLEAGDKILLAAGGASQFDAILAIREKLLSSAIEEWKMQATAALGTGAAAAYTCPAGKYAQFVMLAGNILSTTAATSVTFKINDVSGTTTLTVANALAINKNQYLPYSLDVDGDDGFLIEAGDSLQANANGTGAVSLVVNASEWAV